MKKQDYRRQKQIMHLSFAILNILGIVLEYGVIYLILHDFLGFSVITSIIITGSLFLFFVIINLYINLWKPQVFTPSKETLTDYAEQLINRLKERYRSITDKDITIELIESGLMNAQMFAMFDHIFINTTKDYTYKLLDESHLEGVLSHELGHALHMSRIYLLASFRISTAISGLLQKLLFIWANKLLRKNNHKTQKFLMYSVFVLNTMLSLMNHLIYYPFLRYEEMAANRLSLAFSNGYSLRGYYYHLKEYERTEMRYFDPLHPPVSKQYEKLRRWMEEAGNEYSDCEIGRLNRIIIKSYENEENRNERIIDFYENCVDHELKGFYPYIANVYYQMKRVDEAKHYYVLATKDDHKPSLRMLKKIAIEEDKLDEILQYNDCLVELGDTHSLIEQKYFGTEFHLKNIYSDGKETAVENQEESIKLNWNHTYEFKQSGKIEVGRFILNRNQCAFLSEDGSKRTFNLANDLIVSKPYQFVDDDNHSYLRQEIYARME